MRLHGLPFLAVLLSACGGTVVLEDGSGGSSSDGAPSGPSTTGVTVGPTPVEPCFTQDDCPGGFVCQFATGDCVLACVTDDTCNPGDACDPCASSSCAKCGDCVAGCLPEQAPPPLSCDSHDDCGSNVGEDVCVFATATCAQRCGNGSPPCKPGTACDDCATSSCPGCRDCIGACVN